MTNENDVILGKKRINVAVDDDLHKEFKVACAKNKVDMTSTLVRLMADYIKKNN